VSSFSLRRPLLLCLSLFATGCSAEPDAAAAPSQPPLLGAEPAPAWWAAEDSHRDSVILAKPIDWSVCAIGVDRGADGLGPPRTLTKATAAPSADRVHIGAAVHTGAQQQYTLRQQFWARLMQPDAGGRTHPTALFASIVPYAQWDGQRRWLVPVVEPGADAGPPALRAFAPTCTSDAFAELAGFPAYYSSVRLEIASQESDRKARLATELGHLVGAELEFLAAPVPLDPPQLPATLGVLLQLVFAQRQAVFLTDRVSNPVSVLAVGVSGAATFNVDPNPAPRVSILFDLDQPSVRALRDALRDQPSAWRLQCEVEGKTMHLAPMADADQPARFHAACAPSPSGGLEIDNFVAPILPIGDLPVITLDGDSLKARLDITGGKAYTPTQSDLDINRANSGKDSTWEIPLRQFERPDGSMLWPLQKTGDPGSAPCGPELRATVAEVLERKRFSVAQACQYTLVEWPRLWSAPLQGCRPDSIEASPDNPELKRCQVARGNAVTLSWPGLLEPVTLSADRTSPKDPRKPIEIGEHLRPRLPFPDNDPWVAAPTSTNGEDPCAIPPRYRTDTVRYLIQTRDGIAVEKGTSPEEERLPTFDAIGWPTNQPLPKEIELRLVQQDPLNTAFVSELSIPWDPVSTSAQRPLADWAGLDARRLYPIRVTQPEPARIDEPLTIHWFADQQSCQAGRPAPDQVPLTLAALTGQQRGPCEWARLFAGGEPASSCVDGDARGGVLEYRFPLLSCGRQRRLFLLAPAKAFDVGGVDLKEWLIEELERLRTSGERVPFDLLTLSPQQGLQRLIRCEDLVESKGDGSALVRTAVAPLRFGADDLRALENLKTITRDPAFQASRLASILYLTDGAGVPDISQPGSIGDWSPRQRQQALESTIPFDQRSHLLEWLTNGVQVRVLTSGPCAAWELMGVTCETLPPQRDARLGLIRKGIGEALRKP
jgi:hypothetical protein